MEYLACENLGDEYQLTVGDRVYIITEESLINLTTNATRCANQIYEQLYPLCMRKGVDAALAKMAKNQAKALAETAKKYNMKKDITLERGDEPVVKVAECDVFIDVIYTKARNTFERDFGKVES